MTRTRFLVSEIREENSVLVSYQLVPLFKVKSCLYFLIGSTEGRY